MTLKNQFQRQAPFLHRNWLRVNALQTSVMGNVSSAPESKASSHDDDAGGAPPNKRRRISSPGLTTVDHLVASPRVSDRRSTLRVEVLKIFHQDTKKAKSLQRTTPSSDVSITEANCRLTISDVSSGRARVLHCQSQICEVKTSPNPHGPYSVSRIDLPTPFYVPEESVFINRPDDNEFDFSDSYVISVELEPAKGSRWPPLELHDLGAGSSVSPASDSSRLCTLSCEAKQLFGRLKPPVILSQGHFPHASTHVTQYLMEIDAKWTSGFQALKRLDKGSKACITAVDPDAPEDLEETPESEPAPVAIDHALPVNGIVSPTSINGVNGIHEHNEINGTPVRNGAGVNGIHETNGINGLDKHTSEEVTHDQEDEPEEGSTPSRALRTREKNKVYNLKVLSDQAQGREKKRRARDAHLAAEIAEIEGRVTYLLPPDQPVCLDYYRCVSCGVYHHSMAQLQSHLQTFHPTYEYQFETTSNGPQFRVSRRQDTYTTPTKVHQPVKAFNLQSFAPSDHVSTSGRVGSDSVEELPRSPRPKTLLDKLQSASPAPVPKAPKPTQRRSARPTPTNDVVVVPKINQLLFHPVSKAQLKAGDQVPKVLPDNSWLIQKHRDSIDDFSDVEPAEKEYIREWDGFILQRSITSPAYFPQAWLTFVQEKAAWLVAANRRMLEFGRHTSYLLVRNVLNDLVINQAFVHINEARAKCPMKTEQDSIETAGDNPQSPSKQSPKVPSVRKASNGCSVCKLPVLGPRFLLCANKKCSQRVYHSDCARVSANMPVDKPDWLCNTCCEATIS
jgi:hypothetical protein